MFFVWGVLLRRPLCAGQWEELPRPLKRWMGTGQADWKLLPELFIIGAELLHFQAQYPAISYAMVSSFAVRLFWVTVVARIGVCIDNGRSSAWMIVSSERMTVLSTNEIFPVLLLKRLTSSWCGDNFFKKSLGFQYRYRDNVITNRMQSLDYLKVSTSKSQL